VRRLLARRSHASAAGSLAEVVRALDAIAGARIPEPAFVEAVWGLPAYLARASGNQVFLLLANSATRFLSAQSRRALEPRDRRALTSALRRLARALQARDPERAERAARDLGRRLTHSLHPASDGSS
jgi:DNA-binding FadR family transcriptional regulator